MRKLINRVIIICSALLFWTILSSLYSPLFVPSPFKVLDTFIGMLDSGILINGLIVSFIRITIATMLSIAVSLPLGLLVVNFKVVKDLIMPISNSMRFVPVTSLYPILMMWFGIGEQMKIIFLFFATFFYFLPTVIFCINEVDNDLIDTGYTMGMNKIQIIKEIILPASLPNICQNFLTMYGIGWTYVIIAEVINSQQGLGHIMNVATARGRTDMVFVVICVIVLFSYLIDHYGKKLIHNIFKWKFN